MMKIELMNPMMMAMMAMKLMGVRVEQRMKLNHMVMGMVVDMVVVLELGLVLVEELELKLELFVVLVLELEF
jgi:hypothetical protein